MSGDELSSVVPFGYAACEGMYGETFAYEGLARLAANCVVVAY